MRGGRGKIAGGLVGGQLALLLAVLAACGRPAVVRQDQETTDGTIAAIVERDVAVPMRDGVVLRADIFRPPSEAPVPVLVYRTPYGRRDAQSYSTHLAAVERGYAVLLQDVRGRYDSEGEFDPYRNEGRDGYDTIEWAAVQAWSNGRVGTFGLSYPGAVQWLAAVESPPHLEAMVPAMTFSTPRNFFYSGGVFDGSWLDWILLNIAPDLRVRHDIAGPRSYEEALAVWQEHHVSWQRKLPLGDFEELRQVAPFFYEWTRHPPDDEWWNWAEIRGKYSRVSAAVLNLSSWHDEAYGPEGAITNFSGLVEGRQGQDARAALLLGPWVHGGTDRSRVGELEFGPDAAIDYDDVVLGWMDRHLKGMRERGQAQPVRYFVMGENRWRDAQSWPPEAEPVSLFLDGSDGAARRLRAEVSARASASSSFVSDPEDPVTDAYAAFGPHDYSEMASRTDLLVFDSEPLPTDLEVTGRIVADLYLSCDCLDIDVWVKLLDVHPDGAAFNLMSSGLDVQRASYRDLGRGRVLLEPGEIFELRLDRLLTSHRFRQGHRIRVQISAAFFPRFSRNLQTGELETESAGSQPATLTVHHDRNRPSRVILPVVENEPAN